MAAALANLAFFLPSGGEMIVILIVGIMLFGRRLPEVGRTVGKTVIQMRQGLQKLKAEMDMDAELAELKDSVAEVRDEFGRTIETPRRAFTDPGKLLMDLTDETLAAPGPEAAPGAMPATDADPSLIEQAAAKTSGE